MKNTKKKSMQRASQKTTHLSLFEVTIKTNSSLKFDKEKELCMYLLCLSSSISISGLPTSQSSAFRKSAS